MIAYNNHTHYFQSYFGHEGIAAKTILIESHYIDKYFLDDYAGFYVRCFDHYVRVCSRLHFFKNEFSKTDFSKLLLDENSGFKIENLKKNYLGFIVVKKLPITVIGRTCLDTYKATEAELRKFPIKRDYKVNLFGIELEVETLAFQEPRWSG